MNITTTHQCISERYPQQLAEIKEKLLKSKSKEKEVPLEKWGWSFDFCVKITSGSFTIFDILQGKVPPRQTPQQLYDERLKNTSCIIRATKGHACIQSSVLDGLPQELIAFWQKEKEGREKEEARTARMTPAEKKAETNELIKQLSHNHGFMKISIPTP